MRKQSLAQLFWKIPWNRSKKVPGQFSDATSTLWYPTTFMQRVGRTSKGAVPQRVSVTSKGAKIGPASPNVSSSTNPLFPACLLRQFYSPRCHKTATGRPFFLLLSEPSHLWRECYWFYWDFHQATDQILHWRPCRCPQYKPAQPSKYQDPKPKSPCQPCRPMPCYHPSYHRKENEI